MAQPSLRKYSSVGTQPHLFTYTRPSCLHRTAAKLSSCDGDCTAHTAHSCCKPLTENRDSGEGITDSSAPTHTISDRWAQVCLLTPGYLLPFPWSQFIHQLQCKFWNGEPGPCSFSQMMSPSAPPPSTVRMCDAVPKSQVHSQLVKLLPKPQRPGLPCCSEVTSSSWSLRLPFSLWPSPQKATALFHWLWQAHFFPLVLILIHLEFRLSFHVPTPTPESCFKCTLPLKSPPQTSISRQIAWSPDSKALNICLKGEVWNP